MKKFAKNIGIYLVIFAFVLVAAFFYKSSTMEETKMVPFSQMASYLQAERVTEINITGTKIDAKLDNGKNVYAYAPYLTQIDRLDDMYIFPQMTEGKIKYSTDKPNSGGTWLSLLPTIIMVIALGFLFYILMNQGGNGKAFSFGKSKAKLYKGDGKKITFADVAGLDEEKEELEEIVDFLKDPRKYKELGARIPKGILLVGPPGTGKTYISRAAAGEAGVPFFTISGSDFVEMFVGVGASRVRDLFDQAKKSAPCIVFIDEIDAVGRKRGAGLGGGNDEREQTLNQLLVEMDGFGENSGIIILAATNRPDVLDPALLRPGRFDREVVIGIPDIKGREEIIKVHSKNKPLSEEVSPKVIARRTPGFTPADLENLLNEAALITARRSGRKIRMAEIEEAATKVMAGPAKKSKVISPEERKLTAYHEAGHAIVMRSLPGSDPVHQVTIIPRGGAGGFTMALPEKDKEYETKNGMLNTIKHLLGGRVAELLTLDDISTGASNDIMRATEIARAMVTKYGFSEKIGPVNYSESDEVFLGKDFSTRKNYSEGVASEIDHEVKQIIEDCFEATKKILTENKDKLETVAQALLDVETLDGEQFEALYTGKLDAKSLAEQVIEKEKMLEKRNAEEAAEYERIRKEEEEKLAAELAKYDEDYLADPEDADLGDDDGDATPKTAPKNASKKAESKVDEEKSETKPKATPKKAASKKAESKVDEEKSETKPKATPKKATTKKAEPKDAEGEGSKPKASAKTKAETKPKAESKAKATPKKATTKTATPKTATTKKATPKTATPKTADEKASGDKREAEATAKPKATKKAAPKKAPAKKTTAEKADGSTDEK